MNWKDTHRKQHPYGFKHRLKCATCGDEFGAARYTTKYCSNACRMKAYRGRQAAKRTQTPQATAIQTKWAQTITIRCQACGAILTLNGAQRTRKYCNNACKQRYYRRTNYFTPAEIKALAASRRIHPPY